MKKLLYLIFISILLVGCGQKVHENIEQGMADDTEQVISIFDKTIKEDRTLTEKEEKVFEEYKVKYSAYEKTDKLSEEENRLFILTRDMIDMYNYHTTLSSDNEGYEKIKKLIRSVIKTGKI